MLQSIKKVILRGISNIPGWSTNRHIIVIESDDWGSIRMPSKEVYKELSSNGVKFSTYGYDQYDTLASREDLQNLFEVCDSVRDINNRPAVITANCVVGNPNFEKIKESGFNEYYYEPMTETLSRYYPNSPPFNLWLEGLEKGYFFPQLHGREHVNVQMWLNSLRENHFGARAAFEKRVFTFLVTQAEDYRIKNTAAFLANDDKEKVFYYKSIIEAQDLFYRLFGYRSESFIAPSFIWDKDIEQWLSEVGVNYLQGMPISLIDKKRHFNYIGKRNAFGQCYLIRNAVWEPTQHPLRDNNGVCLQQISLAFKWHKPATISSHRLNYIGALDINNRDQNLKRLKELLVDIKRIWPDVEFMNSVELGSLIRYSIKKNGTE